MQSFYFRLWQEGPLTPDDVGVALPCYHASNVQAPRQRRDKFEGAATQATTSTLSIGPQTLIREPWGVTVTGHRKGDPVTIGSTLKPCRHKTSKATLL